MYDNGNPLRMTDNLHVGDIRTLCFRRFADGASQL
jgi:hypothetical protein